jgi:hypothetical protein
MRHVLESGLTILSVPINRSVHRDVSVVSAKVLARGFRQSEQEQRVKEDATQRIRFRHLCVWIAAVPAQNEKHQQERNCETDVDAQNASRDVLE